MSLPCDATPPPRTVRQIGLAFCVHTHGDAFAASKSRAGSTRKYYQLMAAPWASHVDLSHLPRVPR
eukprot:9060043-Pyramimonas_sp.AAC.1